MRHCPSSVPVTQGSPRWRFDGSDHRSYNAGGIVEGTIVTTLSPLPDSAHPGVKQDEVGVTRVRPASLTGDHSEGSYTNALLWFEALERVRPRYTRLPRCGRPKSSLPETRDSGRGALSLMSRRYVCAILSRPLSSRHEGGHSPG